MHSIIRSLVFAGGLLLSLTAPAAERGPTALDLAQLLLEGQGQLDDTTVIAILSSGIESNMRVAPEHLGVAFWDDRTGERLDRQEIRELVGPVRQDGAWQLLDIALSLSNDRLLLDEEQLRLLLDAAFLASMRRPPGHISIEYYDRRQGPTGEGGGVSGRVPDSSETASPPPRAPESLPSSELELLEIMTGLGFTVEEQPGRYLFPIVFWTTDADQLEARFEKEIAGLEELGFVLDRLTDQPIVKKDGSWLIFYALGHFQPSDSMGEEDLQDAKMIHQLFLEHRQ